MRKLRLVSFWILLLLTQACYDETGIISGEPPVAPPAIDFESAIGLIFKDTTLQVGAELKVRVNVVSGTSPLNRIEVYRDSMLINSDQIAFNGSSGNTFLISNSSAEDMIFEIDITETPTTVDTFTYQFTIFDEAGSAATDSLVLKFHRPLDIFSTSQDSIFQDPLKNQANTQSGGLDLDTGREVDDLSTSAEIRDQGNRINDGGEIWRQTIAGANGTEVRYVNLTQIRDWLTYERVRFKEQIIEAFELGSVFSGEDFVFSAEDSTKVIATDLVDEELVSFEIKEGDLMAVKRGDRYYLLSCFRVNPTIGSDDDNYSFSVKY